MCSLHRNIKNKEGQSIGMKITINNAEIAAFEMGSARAVLRH